jgi:ribosomal protein S18 acetylase RimI-like enzyme
LLVRDATPDDAETIVGLTVAGWEAAYGPILGDEAVRNLPVSAWRHEVNTGLRAPEADSFTKLAELEGAIAGYCYVAAPGRGEPSGSKLAEVVALYVEPGVWRRGVGRALMTAAGDEAKERGYEVLRLECFEENAPALAFYGRIGFTRDGTRHPHQATGAPAVGLRRSLHNGP